MGYRLGGMALQPVQTHLSAIPSTVRPRHPVGCGAVFGQ
jgi:hypothetical protein